MQVILRSGFGRYAIGLENETAHILSDCCEVKVEYIGGRFTSCTKCGRREGGYSDNSHALNDSFKYWVSLWTLIDQQDLTIIVDGKELE